MALGSYFGLREVGKPAFAEKGAVLVTMVGSAVETFITGPLVFESSLLAGLC
mgnify:CR=1 FL=1